MVLDGARNAVEEGAHLAEGSVQGEQIRCLFHGWTLHRHGHCVAIPSEKDLTCVERIRSHQVRERFRLIWIWVGEGPAAKFPAVPELDGEEVVTALESLASRYPDTVHVLELDVTVPEHRTRAREYVPDAFGGRMDGLVSNAGFGSSVLSKKRVRASYEDSSRPTSWGLPYS